MHRCLALPWLFLLIPLNVTASGSRHYVGSQACKSCHLSIYKRWKNTRMANVVQDPRSHPQAFLCDFSKPNPYYKFRKQDVAFVYGSHWKQRYFVKRGNQYYALPVQWDIVHHVWLKYHPGLGEDWWVPYYPDDPMKRPTGPLCDGCHSVNYNITTETVTEWNVGCERCHGPGSEHIRVPWKQGSIVNPARLDFVRANDVCIQCHSQLRPLSNPIHGIYYDWAVGYQPGDRLSDYVRLEDHQLGVNNFFYWPDGSAHKNREQGNDFVTSVMYVHGVTCFSCHDPHGSENDNLLIKPGSAMCLECHGPRSPNGPRGETLEAHTHHPPGSPGSDCIACHMPQIATEIGTFRVHSHTFRFISPALTMKYGIPNPCTSCHKNKSNEWALEQLGKWQNESPWRFER